MKTNTVCRLCSSCCPVEVEIETERLIAGARRSPLQTAERTFCPKLKAAPDIVYSPERLKKPLVRKKGKRGNPFVESSWEDALGLVAEKFLSFRQRYGAESVCWLRGMASDWGAPWDYANRLMSVFGSPNTIGNGSVCHVGREMAHTYTYGAMTFPDIKNSRCIVVWGKNDSDTNPQAFEAILYARGKGAKLIVIDPVRTKLAAMADIWLQVKPGHDGLLAMAVINEIISCGLYDHDMVENYSTGFERLKEAAARYRAGDIARAIWLEPERIKDAARIYAETKPACIIEGNGLDMQINAFQHTRAVCILRALTGNLDQKGGDLIPQPIPVRNLQLRERLPEGVKPVTHEYPLFNEFHETWGKNAQSCIIDAILAERPYPLKMLMVQSANPVVTMADSNRVLKALEKLEFLAVVDLFMTRTARMADVVLPATSSFEKTQLNRAYIRNNMVMIQNQVIDWIGESRPDWKITFELARRLGMEKEFPWQTAEEAIDYQLEPAGITVEMLREKPEGIRVGETIFEKYKTIGVATPSGRVELYSKRLEEHGHSGVPVFEGRARNPISFSDRKDEFPLIGMSGARQNRFTHSQFRNIPSLSRKGEECHVEINEKDAEIYGISVGGRVKVETPRGHVIMKAKISELVHPGSIRIAWGWGDVSPDYNLNNLTDDNIRDEVICTPSSRNFMCRVSRC